MINELQKKYDDIIYHANRIMLNGPEEFIKLFDEFVEMTEDRYNMLIYRIKCKLDKWIKLLETDGINSKKIVLNFMKICQKIVDEDFNYLKEQEQNEKGSEKDER